MTSSPPQLNNSSKREEDSFKMAAGKSPGRRELAQLMGVEYSDKSRKQYLRTRLKDEMSKFLDIKGKPFKELDWVEELWPVIKRCQSTMRKEHQVDWTKKTIYHLMHTIYEDTRRNAGSKEKCAAKRKEKRISMVSSDSNLASNLPSCPLSPCAVLTFIGRECSLVLLKVVRQPRPLNVPWIRRQLLAKWGRVSRAQASRGLHLQSHQPHHRRATSVYDTFVDVMSWCMLNARRPRAQVLLSAALQWPFESRGYLLALRVRT